jgi:hypothetical protein
MSELRDELVKLLDQKDDKNFDPRMEELLRSDRLIDPKNETLSDLEDQEIFHIAKIRGAQVGFKITMKDLQKIYALPHLADYHCNYIDYIRSLDPVKDKELLDSNVGGLPMLNVMIEELIKLRRSKEGWAAKLYADSIKPQVANVPMPYPQPAEEQQGLFAKIFNFFLGKKKDEGTQGYQGRR